MEIPLPFHLRFMNQPPALKVHSASVKIPAGATFTLEEFRAAFLERLENELVEAATRNTDAHERR